MDRSRDWQPSLLSEYRALQHERSPQKAPRPLPLFLEMVRVVGERDPQVAEAALRGLIAYQHAERRKPAGSRRIAARAGPATLRHHGGRGPPAVLIPSLINPPRVLDLDPQVSLAACVARAGRQALLLDWGKARERVGLSVAGHVEELLLPLLRELGEPAALVGYCLGGTMAIAAANLVATEQVITLAAPWHFASYPDEGRAALARLWRLSGESAEALGVLPIEVLQAAFWSLDPERTVAKFASFSELPPDSPQARRFVALEDWANAGEPLPYPAARELIEDFFQADLPGAAAWKVAGRAVRPHLPVPLLHCTARRDRIAPAESAPEGETVQIPAGHVGMVVGSAREELHRILHTHLAAGRTGD